MINDKSSMWDGPTTASRLGEILLELHSIDTMDCPFGGPPEREEVLVHGDYCSPNVLVENDRLTALVDVGRARVDSPRIDFAAAIWSLQYSFGAGFGQMFLDAYGTPPMTDREIERLRRSYSRR